AAPAALARQPPRRDRRSAARRGHAAGVREQAERLARLRGLRRRAPRHPAQLGDQRARGVVGTDAAQGERVGQAVDALISTLPLAGGSKSTARSVGLFGEGTAVKIALFRRDCPLPEKYLAPLDIFRPSREREG